MVNESKQLVRMLIIRTVRSCGYLTSSCIVGILMCPKHNAFMESHRGYPFFILFMPFYQELLGI